MKGERSGGFQPMRLLSPEIRLTSPLDPAFTSPYLTELVPRGFLGATARCDIFLDDERRG